MSDLLAVYQLVGGDRVRQAAVIEQTSSRIVASTAYAECE